MDYLSPWLTRVIMARVPPKPWPDGSDERLKELHRANRSATQIADALAKEWPDHGFTRNMIVGRVFRHKLVNARSNGPLSTRQPQKLGRRIGFDWTDEQDAFLKDQYAFGRMPPSIAEEFFRKFEMSIDRHQVRRRLIALEVWDRKRETQPHSFSPKKAGVRKAAMHVAIIEDAPPTSMASADLDYRYQCPWPTSEDASQSCGSPVTCGAYCARHAKMAYRVMPTERRQRTYHA